MSVRTASIMLAATHKGTANAIDIGREMLVSCMVIAARSVLIQSVQVQNHGSVTHAP